MDTYSESNLAELLTLRKVVDKDGNTYYFNKDNKLHRIHGPAVEVASGTKEWWVNGHPHREDGPAIIWDNGTKVWLKYGVQHRVNGPAVIWFDGGKEWWINGKYIRRELS